MSTHLQKESTCTAAPAKAPAPVSARAGVENSLTPANLQTAYSGETNARIRYLAFAKQADEENYAPVASLFRAAARAEEIHATNHAEVIRHLGNQPKLNTEAFIVKSTAENLESAIRGEIYERDEMYPAFLQKARAEGIQAAIRTFHFAQKAEAEHAALFTEALRELAKLRGEAIPYYVCPVCGFTTIKVDGARCPVCGTVAHRFESVI